MSVSVSETIGKLLLEGYKMLADSCDVCCTVLMQDRRGRVICVQCESTSMANAARPDADVRPSGKIVNGGANKTSHYESTVTSSEGMSNTLNNPANPDDSNRTVAISCEEALFKEIQNTTTNLQNLTQLKHDIEGKLLYVRYIRECAETIKTMRTITKT